MIEGTMDWLRPQPDVELDAILRANARERKWKGLTLTGAEITLRSDLPVLARRARDCGFEHVRIQTHGARLADVNYCRTLIEAGIDEFFVSVTAADAVTHDAITGVPGSFMQTLRGLENLDGYADATIVTNTVITTRSYRQLPDVVTRLGKLRRLAQMEFWSYWPMREQDDYGLIVNHVDSLPYLREAIERASALGRRVEVKNFPECLLGRYGDALDNGQPRLMIDPEFWVQFMRNGFHQCVHRSNCGSQRCLGLNTAYVNKFGWQADTLAPLPKEH
jgi:MoaA/NifB/PqqE/SkfB family radical SAM enzyme